MEKSNNMLDQDININQIFFGKYKCEKKIGKGSFGTVYQGTCLLNNQKIAMKFETIKKINNTLEGEAHKLLCLQGKGIPQVIYYGKTKTNNILIQELLSKSLEDIFTSMKKKFSLKTVCVLGIQMISRIQYVHSKHHIHRDIKPDNFMIGRGENENTVFIIDFGLSKKYFSITKQEHIKFCKGKSLIGTARYCAKNAHRGYEQSRRDDIESIGYVLLYFLIGKLPWQGLKANRYENQFDKIAEKKENTSFSELCKGQHEEFLLYFNHIEQLYFEDEPNYEYLIGLFQQMINKYCIGIFYDFDWKRDTCNYLSIFQENQNKSRGVSLLVNKNGLSTTDESRNLPDKNEEKKTNVRFCDNDSVPDKIEKEKRKTILTQKEQVDCFEQKRAKIISNLIGNFSKTERNYDNHKNKTHGKFNRKSSIIIKGNHKNKIFIDNEMKENEQYNKYNNFYCNKHKSTNSEFFPPIMNEEYNMGNIIYENKHHINRKHISQLPNSFTNELIKDNNCNNNNNSYNNINDKSIEHELGCNFLHLKYPICNIDEINLKIASNLETNCKGSQTLINTTEHELLDLKGKPPLACNNFENIKIKRSQSQSRNKEKNISKTTTEPFKDSTRCSCILF